MIMTELDKSTTNNATLISHDKYRIHSYALSIVAAFKR
jgi:hypothetical protein